MSNTKESQQSDRAFDPYRIPHSPKAQEAVDSIITSILHYEDFKGTRRRKRKAADLLAFRRIVTALICDLVHNHLINPDQVLFISLSKQQNQVPKAYRAPDMAKVLPSILDCMAAPELAFVVLEKGSKGFGDMPGRRSTIKCGKRLESLIKDKSLWLDDFAQDPLKQSIILKSSKVSYFDTSRRIDYQDTPIIQTYRAEMLLINQWLNNANLDYPSSTDKIVDTSDRFLNRVFNEGVFDKGGRLFGGFWQHLKKEEREQDLYINDEPIVTLDYSQACPRIAYGVANMPWPEFDAYTLDRWKYSRGSVKQIFNAMIFADHPLTRFPKDTKAQFGSSTRFIEIRDHLLSLHQPIAHLFGTGLGMKLMFIESKILVACLLECIEQGIVALPVHDALIVAESAKERTREIMLKHFKLIAGVDGLVDEEGTRSSSSLDLALAYQAYNSQPSITQDCILIREY